MMLMLTLDDAIKVTQRLVEDAMNDEDIIRQELEQKCWVPSDGELAKRLYDLVFDINPAEICAQIEAGNLKNWCETIQVEMNLAMVRLPSAQPEPCDDPRADVYYLAEKIGIHRLYALVVELRGEPEPCEDAVSREAVSEWLKQYGQDVLHGKYKFSLMYIWKNLMGLPSAQPEIIRCGECKHWREDHTCGEHSLVSPMMAYEFCSRAERRQDEHIG